MFKWFARRILRDEIAGYELTIGQKQFQIYEHERSQSVYLHEIAADGERIMSQAVDIEILKDKIATLEDRLKKRPSQTDIARANLRMFGQMAKIKDLADKNPAVLAGDILLILEGK